MQSGDSPFRKNLDLIASISDGEQTVNGVHVIIEYDPDRPCEILGVIMGDQEKAGELMKLTYSPRSEQSFLAQDSVDSRPEEPYRIVRSDRFQLGGFKLRSGFAVHHPIAEIHFQELEISVPRPFPKEDDPKVVFYVTGPADLWEDIEWERPEGQELPSEKRDYRLFEVGSIKVEACRTTLEQGHAGDKDCKLVKSLMTLRCTWIADSSGFSNDRLLDQSTNVVNNTLAIASLISHQWVSWYGYRQTGPQGHCYRNRNIRSHEARPFNWWKTAVGRHQRSECWSHLVGQLMQSTNRDEMIDRVIADFVDSFYRHYMDDRFSLLIFALEKLKDMYAKRTGSELIQGKEEFKTLCKAVRKRLKEVVEEKDVRSLIIEKFGELNRWPAKRVVLDLMQELKVEWKDLYPEGVELSIFDTRNRMFHSLDWPDLQTLEKETYRLSAIVERLLFRSLGWKEDLYVPEDNVREYCIEENKAAQ